jgi:hypothetical protein
LYSEGDVDNGSKDNSGEEDNEEMEEGNQSENPSESMDSENQSENNDNLFQSGKENLERRIMSWGRGTSLKIHPSSWIMRSSQVNIHLKETEAVYLKIKFKFLNDNGFKIAYKNRHLLEK